MKDDAIPLDEERFLKLKPKILLSIIALVGAAVASWGAIKFDLRDVRRDVADHSKALDQISSQLQVIESEARKARETTATIERASREAELKNQYTQELINQKLDYLTGDKRGPRPASGPP
jgi:lysyl-tRNA synthetase class I